VRRIVAARSRKPATALRTSVLGAYFSKCFEQVQRHSGGDIGQPCTVTEKGLQVLPRQAGLHLPHLFETARADQRLTCLRSVVHNVFGAACPYPDDLLGRISEG